MQVPPRPVVQVSSSARVLIAGQAPGRKVFESGVPFDDRSGDRLRDWMGIDRGTFYDEQLIAIVPMGFCYPGKGRSGDLPPRSECAPAWRERVLSTMEAVRTTLVVGGYAIAYHMPSYRGRLTQAVKDWRDFYPAVVPLPHPSPRNVAWFKANPWFESELIPAIRQVVSRSLDDA